MFYTVNVTLVDCDLSTQESPLVVTKHATQYKSLILNGVILDIYGDHLGKVY